MERLSSTNLCKFPPVPGAGKVTVCEIGNVLKSFATGPEAVPEPIDYTQSFTTSETYHHILGNDLRTGNNQHRIPAVRTNDDVQAFMLQESTSWVKGTWNAFLDQGLSGLVTFVQNDQQIPGALKTVFNLSSNIWESVQNSKRKLIIYVYPHYALDVEDLLEQYAPVRNWKTGWVRALAWHPTYSKLAIALQDDSIRILTNGVQDGFPYVKSMDQRRVASIAWRPFSPHELAIGVKGGVLVWNLDGSIKPASNKSTLLSRKNHSPVTCVEYSSNGRHIISSSSRDSTIYIWNADSYEPFALHRYGGGGVPLVSWSPDGTQLFSTTPTAMFKVWTASKKWVPERWKTPKPVDAMCWFPEGDMVIFASGSGLYTISIVHHEQDFVDAAKARLAVHVYNLSKVEVLEEGASSAVQIGGAVRKLKVSPDGSRLAILFVDSEVVALFRVQRKSKDFLFPIGFIRGYQNEYPVALDFQRNLKKEAVMTIAWSSSRLQHFPMLESISTISSFSPSRDAPIYRTGIIHRNSVRHETTADFEVLNPSRNFGGAGDMDTSVEETSYCLPRVFSSPSPIR